jgi:disulfide bond formation protein DsbB
MNLEQYSSLLSFFVLLLGTAVFFSILSYYFSPTTRLWLSKVSYDTWLKLIAGLAIIATAGALIYQYHYLLPVCHLCWWQRIFMFPIELIIAVSLYTKSKTNHLIVAIMAGIGLPIALYHYYGHYQKYVVGNPFLLPCSTNPLETSCSNSPIVTFGFITIPFMAVIVFLAILWLSYLAFKKSN